MKMTMKSVSSLVMLTAVLAYGAMLVGVNSPPEPAARTGERQNTVAPHRIVRRDAPRPERTTAPRPVVYFATAR